MMKDICYKCFICIFLAVFLCGCVDFHPIPDDFMNKRLVSEDPDLYIDMVFVHSSSGHSYIYGERTLGNGKVEKIVFRHGHGNFNIWRFNTEEVYGAGDPPLYTGMYRIKGETLVLIDESGLEIILKAQEIPTTQAVMETTTTSSITSETQEYGPVVLTAQTAD